MDLESLLDPIRSDPATAGVLTDFDGTLAPIVDDPATSRPLPEVVGVLHALAGRYARVAVVSGRPAAFLAEHLRLDEYPQGLIAFGLYGLERAGDGHVTTDGRALAWVAVIDELAGRAEAEAPAGAIVERKGLSLVLHYRTAPTAALWAQAWAIEQAARTGLARHPGRMSEELRPAVPVDKGTVVASLVDGLGAACFLGDDAGDLPAFAVLDDLRAGQGVATLKVGVRSDEAPPELLHRADLVVDGPPGALDLLSRL